MEYSFSTCRHCLSSTFNAWQRKCRTIKTPPTKLSENLLPLKWKEERKKKRKEKQTRQVIITFRRISRDLRAHIVPGVKTVINHYCGRREWKKTEKINENETKDRIKEVDTGAVTSAVSRDKPFSPFSSFFFTIYFYPIFVLCVLSFVAVSVLCVDYPFFSVNPTDVTTHVALAHLQSKYAADELSFIDIYIFFFCCILKRKWMNECDILVFWNLFFFFLFPLSPLLLSALVIADLLLRFAELKIPDF